MHFIGDPKQIQKGLFAPYMARSGVQTALNVNFIPDLLHYTKQKMTPDELLRLEDYHLQNYLMELSLTYNESANLEQLTNTILTHIRGSNHFWYRHNNQEQINEEQQLKRHAIVRYNRDVLHLKKAFQHDNNMKTYQPTYPRRTSLTQTFHMFHSNSQPHFGTRQPLNHLAFIPSFIINRQAQKKAQPLPNQVIRDTQKQEILQESIIYFLSNKSDTIITKHNLEDRQFSEVQQQSLSSELQKSVQQQKTLFDQFLQFTQKQMILPKFPSSHHMHSLTENLLIICIHLNNQLSKQRDSSTVHFQDNTLLQLQQISPLRILALSQEVKDTLSAIADRLLSPIEVELLSNYFLLHWQSQLKRITSKMRQRELETLAKIGWLNTELQIQNIKQVYQQMLDQPQFIQLTRYRALGTGIPWKDEDYLKFLKGLNEYLNIPTNNKRIASFMGEGFQPNHVKHVKAVYLTVMKERMERGECGGGKRGKSLSKSDFIEKDMNNFSMRWFEKAKKIRKKKLKKKRKNSLSDDDQEDVDSDY